MWGGFSSSDWFQAGSKIKTLNSPLTHSGIDCGVIGVKKKVQVLEMYLYIVKV